MVRVARAAREQLLVLESITLALEVCSPTSYIIAPKSACNIDMRNSWRLCEECRFIIEVIGGCKIWMHAGGVDLIDSFH